MRRCQGFTMLELVLVVIIITTLMAAASIYYVQVLTSMKKESVRTQANYFRAATTTLRSEWLINRFKDGKSSYRWLDQEVFLTNRGWLANSDKMLSAKANDQTVFECWQLWQAIFQTGSTASMQGVSKRGDADYHIYSLSGEGCRFELLHSVKRDAKAESHGGHYFDYYLSDGRILVSIQDETGGA